MVIRIIEMQCILCLGVRAPQHDFEKISDSRECPYEEYLNICKKYLTVDLVNVEIQKSPEGYLPVIPICSVCFCSVDQLYKIHQELQDIQTKLVEYSIAFSEILVSCRSKIDNIHDAAEGSLEVNDQMAIKEEESFLNEDEYAIILEFEAEYDKDNTAFKTHQQTIEQGATVSNIPNGESLVKEDQDKKSVSKKKTSAKAKNSSSVQENSNDCSEDDSNTDVLFGCWKCDQKFKNQKEFDVHSRSHLAIAKYDVLCTDCGKKFSDNGCLKRHQNQVHSKSEKSVKCEICDKLFTCERYLKEHKKFHTARNCKCDICGKSYVYPKQLQNHKIESHGGVNDGQGDGNEAEPQKVDQSSGGGSALNNRKMHPCDVCNKNFTMKTVMEEHKRVHTGEKPFSCDEIDCGMNFRTKLQLKCHKNRRHSDVFPYVCPDEQCGKRYKIKQELKEHLPTHNVQDKVMCDQCDKRFNTKRLLSWHIRRVHDKVPWAFVCQICGVSKETSSKLNLHMRIHTGEKPYECSHCHRRFTSTTRMNQHRKEKGH